MLATSNKCDQFLSCEELSWKFLKEIRVLDPNQLLIISANLSSYSTISELSKQKSTDLSGQAVQKRAGEPCDDVLAFWTSMLVQMPTLSAIAMKYFSIPTNSMDDKRLFRAYGNVVTDKSPNLSDNNTKMLIGLYINAVNGSFFDFLQSI